MSIGLATLLASIVIIALWLWLIIRLLSKSGLGGGGQGKGKGDGAGGKEEDEKSKAEQQAKDQAQKEEQKRREQEAREKAQNKQQEQIVEALQKDPLLRNKLEQMARLQDLPEMTDAEKAREIMQKLPAHVLQVLVVAGTQKDIEMDLDTIFTREKSLFPTHDLEPVPMSSLEQMSQLLPEQMMLDDEFFYPALINEELLILQPFERKVERKTLHITLDLSNSMAKGNMSDGLTRHNWSRGITVSLLLKAVNGEATYMMRGFAGHSYALDIVDSPEAAQKLIDKLLKTAANGSGTNIWGAIVQAVADVREVKRPGEIADILVITDGEDTTNKGYGKKEFAALFGEDIRLHVVAIGLHAPALQAGATTYKEFK